MKIVTNLFSAALAVSLLTPALTLAQAKPPVAAQTAPPAAANPKATPATAPTATAPTAKEIADAKAKGMVWVDTKSGVYFRRGHSFGKTAEGKFMTEADAKTAGFHSARTAVAKHNAAPKTETK
jgi:hypothetical protein